MSRVPALDLQELSDRQSAIFEQIASSRGGVVRGPFAIWLRNPDLADAADRLGGQLRVSGTLSGRVFELVVLTIARHWSAQYEWFAHEEQARRDGLADDIIEAVREGSEPDFSEPEDAAAYRVTTELLRSRSLSTETYELAIGQFELDELIELVTVIGFYSMVAMVLNAFDAPVPGDARPLPATRDH